MARHHLGQGLDLGRVVAHQVGEVLVTQADPRAEVRETSARGSACAHFGGRVLTHVEGGKASRSSLSPGLSGIGCLRCSST
jgi:hypothetical protein